MKRSQKATTAVPPVPAERLPLSALLALAMTGFICIVTETLPAGLLPQMVDSLHVSQALAGQMVTAYAFGSMVAAIPLMIATRKWRRRTVLLATIVGFLIFNSITGLSSSYPLTMVARFLAGVTAGLAWSQLAGYARRMVVPALQGRALAVAMVGTPIALSLGVPLGTWLGTLVGWRVTFGIMSLLTIVLIAWVASKVPDYPGHTDAQRTGLLKVMKTPGVRPVLSVIVTWMLAHNVLCTYIAPFLRPAGLAGSVSMVLMIFGLMALAGIFVISQIIDRHLRKTVIGSLALFALTALAFGLWHDSATVLYFGIGIWGLTFGGAATLLQTALADAAGDGADVAISLCVVTWNGAIAGGGLLGGLLLNNWGVESFPWFILMLVASGLVIACTARKHAFTPDNQRGAA